MKIIFKIVGEPGETIHDNSIISEVPNKGDNVVLLTSTGTTFHGKVVSRIIDYQNNCMWIRLKYV